MAEYSYVPLQVVDVDENVIFTNGARCCKKGYVQHREDSGLFFLCGARQCKAVYKVSFSANIAVSAADDGGVLEPISIALAINGETLGSTLRTVTPAAIGDAFAVAFQTFVDVPCNSSVTISVENATDGTSSIDVTNANIIIERVA